MSKTVQLRSLQQCIRAVTKNYTPELLRLENIVIEFPNNSRDFYAVLVARLAKSTHVPVIGTKFA
jgi:hypothetical protein